MNAHVGFSRGDYLFRVAELEAENARLRSELECLRAACREASPISAIITATCEHFGVCRSDIVSKRHAGFCTIPRQIIMHIAREDLSVTLAMIGRALGGRDHTTVLHGHRKIAARIAKGAPISADVEAIRARLKAGRAGA